MEKRIRIDLAEMNSANEAPMSPEEHFALLAATHHSPPALEEARLQFLKTLPSHEPETYRLQLILVQQMIGRCLEEEPGRVSALLQEEKSLLDIARQRGIYDSVLDTRSRLLRASVDGNEKTKLFQEITARFPAASDVRSVVSGNTPQDLNVSKGLCPNGHALHMFSTPTSKFSEFCYFCCCLQKY
jgi:hypothetical protein